MEVKRNHIIYLCLYANEGVKEGGESRNKAFLKKMISLQAGVYNLFNKNIFKRLYLTVNIFLVLFFSRKKTILIHQGAWGYLFPISIFRHRLAQLLMTSTINHCSKKNKLIYEINDLTYEQSIDLELKLKYPHASKIWQDKLLGSRNCHYIFAAHEMERYASQKYSIQSGRTSVVLNGAPPLIQEKPSQLSSRNMAWIESDKLKFVYAGTLNRGRQIEEVIAIFGRLQNVLLILLGAEGDWIQEEKLPLNVIYLGSLTESEAHYIVSECNMGLIPYDENRLYYNICYPTKVPFYLMAGVPILSTPLRELQQLYADKEMFLFSPLNSWSETIGSLSKLELDTMKQQVLKNRDSLTWDSVLNSLQL